MAATSEDESVLPLEPEHQRQFDTTLRATNLLVQQESLMQAANKNVTKLVLKRTLPEHISLGSLMSKLENLQVLFLFYFVHLINPFSTGACAAQSERFLLFGSLCQIKLKKKKKERKKKGGNFIETAP